MSLIKKYASRWLLFNQDTKGLPSFINGKGFKLYFEPSSTLKQDSTQSSNLEVMIITDSLIRAQFVSQLITATDCLLNAVADFDDINQFIVYEVDNDINKRNVSKYSEFPAIESPVTSISKPNIPLICKIAAKASFRKKYVIALNKFFISCKLHTNYPIDLDPCHSPNISLSPFPYDHLNYAYAIMISYSIIEELQLEIRASPQKPSFINGKWNPIVKKDLEHRLIKAGIDINDPISWNIRGGKKSLEKRRPPKTINKASWSYGTIRDCDVMLIDAISDLGWLRSKISAHKVDNDIKKLSVYDVANAQHLVRRILLEHLGFWNKL